MARSHLKKGIELHISKKVIEFAWGHRGKGIDWKKQEGGPYEENEEEGPQEKEESLKNKSIQEKSSS